MSSKLAFDAALDELLRLAAERGYLGTLAEVKTMSAEMEAKRAVFTKTYCPKDPPEYKHCTALVWGGVFCYTATPLRNANGAACCQEHGGKEEP